jgi:hypothetical protein
LPILQVTSYLMLLLNDIKLNKNSPIARVLRIITDTIFTFLYDIIIIIIDIIIFYFIYTLYV